MSSSWRRGEHFRSVHDVLPGAVMPGSIADLERVTPENAEDYFEATAWPACIACAGYFPKDSDHWDEPGHPRWWLRAPGAIVEVPALFEPNLFDRLAAWWRRSRTFTEDWPPGTLRRHAGKLLIAVLLVAIAIFVLSLLPVSVTNPPPQ